MNKYPTLYKVHLVDFDGNQTDHYVNYGLIYASDYADAAKQLEDYYGEELDGIGIEMYEEGLVEIPQSSLPLIRDILSGKVPTYNLMKGDNIYESFL